MAARTRRVKALALFARWCCAVAVGQGGIPTHPRGKKAVELKLALELIAQPAVAPRCAGGRVAVDPGARGSPGGRRRPGCDLRERGRTCGIHPVVHRRRRWTSARRRAGNRCSCPGNGHGVARSSARGGGSRRWERCSLPSFVRVLHFKNVGPV